MKLTVIQDCSCRIPRSAAKNESGLWKRFAILLFLLALWTALYSALEPFSKAFTYLILGLTPASPFASALEFFLFEVPKVVLLLMLIVYIVGVLRTFFTPERSRQLLSGKREHLWELHLRL